MDFVVNNDLLLEKIISYLPNEDIWKVRKVSRQWYCVVNRILTKNHYILVGSNVLDDFTPEFSTDLMVGSCLSLINLSIRITL